MKLFLSVLSLACVLFVSSNAIGGGSYLELGSVQKTKQTVLVSPVGTESENGAALLSALSQIADALPSESNRFLLKIEPGVYDLRSSTLAMQEYVDIEGSGVETTLLKSSVNFANGEFVIIEASVSGADHAELRFFTLENRQIDEPRGNVIGIFNSGCSPTIYRVNVKCETQEGYNAYGIYNSSGSPLISHVNIDVGIASTIYGVYNIHDSQTAIMDTNINGYGCFTSCYGIYNDRGTTGTARYDLERVNIVLTSSSDIQRYGAYNAGNSDGIAIMIKWSRIDTENSYTNSVGIFNEIDFNDENDYTINILSSIISANALVSGEGVFNCAFCVDGGHGATNADCSN